MTMFLWVITQKINSDKGFNTMSKNTDSSIKLLVLYDILLKSTDEEHALSTNEIIEELK